MGSIERNTPAEWDRKTLEPVIGQGMHRAAPRGLTQVGFVQASGVNQGVASVHVHDNDHCRLMMVKKPVIPGGSTLISQNDALRNTQYQFKSSYDEQPKSGEEKK